MSTEVIAYTTTTCPHCHRLKVYLTQHQIPFENRDVTTDEAAAEELQRMNAPGVPVIQVGKQVIFGFDEAKLGQLLKADGVPN